MRARSVLSTLFVTLMIVVGLDYVTFAATGKSLVLGKTNSANKVTTVKRTTPGPAMKFKVKKGKNPPFSTNGKGRVKNLNADRIDGRQGSQLAGKAVVTTFQGPGCGSLDTATPTAQKIDDLGTFAGAGTKFVEIDFSTTVMITSGTANATVFELRIDNVTSTLGSAQALVNSYGPNHTVRIGGVFTGVPRGIHTVSLWGHTSTGSASDVYYDPGCYNTRGNNLVTVKQFD